MIMESKLVWQHASVWVLVAIVYGVGLYVNWRHP